MRCRGLRARAPSLNTRGAGGRDAREACPDMVAIADQDLQQVVAHFEDMIDALRLYRATLLSRRDRYESEHRDPIGYAHPLASNLKRIERLQQPLDGRAYDAVRTVLDVTGLSQN